MHDGLDEAKASATECSFGRAQRIDLVKVFSVTKARDRETLGDAVTAWIAANPQVRVLETFVRLSSDSAFHCLSIVLIGASGSQST